jgi:phage tail sheath gpL-like
MASTVIRITDAKPTAKLYGTNKPARLARWGVGNLSKYLYAIASGIRKATVTSVVDGTTLAEATGTLTLSSASGAVGGTINGVAVTATASGGDTNSAALVAAAINASANALVAGMVYATSAGAVVTVRARHPGKLGNATTLAASGTGVTASGARLTGGAGDDTAPTSYNLL